MFYSSGLIKRPTELLSSLIYHLSFNKEIIVVHDVVFLDWQTILEKCRHRLGCHQKKIWAAHNNFETITIYERVLQMQGLDVPDCK